MNGYAQLWTTSQPPYVPPGWTEWRGMKSVKYFDYVMVEPNGLGGYVENAYGSADSDYSTDVLREKAKDFISRLGRGERAVLPVSRLQGARTCRRSQRPATKDCSRPCRPGVRRATTRPMSRTSRSGCRTHRYSMRRHRPISTRSALTNSKWRKRSRGNRRQHDLRHRRHHAAPAQPGYRRQHHRRVLRRQRLAVGRASNARQEQALRRADSLPDVRYYPKLAPLPRTETRFALNIDIAPTLLELAGGTATITQSGESLVQVIDGTNPPGAPTS